MKKYYMAAVLLCLIVFNQNVKAEELGQNEAAEENYIYETLDNIVDNQGGVLEYSTDTYEEEEEQLNDEYDLINNMNMASSVQDDYESNNTLETAYMYSLTKMINSTISHKGTLYNLGMRSARIDSVDDEDWF